MEKKNASILLDKYNKGKCSPGEKAIVESWFLALAKDESDGLPKPDYERVGPELWTAIQRTNKKRIAAIWPRIAAAASIVLCLGAGVYLLIHKGQPKPQIAASQIHDIAPGGGRATLTLANGTKIRLDNTSKGVIARQNGAIVRLTSGAILYSVNHTNKLTRAVNYNTLTTQKGEEYPIVLGDGTKAWLNAESSITYPVAFTGKERKVTITGEVYFEVVHNPDHPFKVLVKNQVIEDLGTQFNINAYDNEQAITATLLEGSIEINHRIKPLILKPGQQALIDRKADEIKLINHADVAAAISWHNGLFQFKNADIPTVMRTLARWYDVEVSYQGAIPSRRFTGKIYRNISALKVSDILKYNDIHFKIEGKKIIVTP